MPKPKVLFLCTGNSARSQMAEGYLRHVAGGYEAMSAGIEPKGLNPLAVEAMREIGIDISRQKSKDVVDFLGSYVPYVVMVCDHAKEHCPIFPGTYKFLHRGFEDPAAARGSHDEKLAVFSEGARRHRPENRARAIGRSRNPPAIWRLLHFPTQSARPAASPPPICDPAVAPP